MKKIALFCCIVMIITCFVSCGFISEDRFYGGELLNDEKMSEIKSSVFATEKKEDNSTVETTNSGADSEAMTQNPAEKADTEETDTTSTGDTEKSDVVFWTKSGEVWHLSEDCRHLKKSTSIISGTLDEAIDQGKKRACSSCGK